VIAGWEEPDSGELVWHLPDDDAGLARWRDVAVVPQKLGLIEELTVRKNVAYPARLAGRDEELEGRVDDLLEEFGLTEMADRLPSETSVGQQQRTALARALVLAPRLLLADEPTGHQDAGWTNGVFDALRRAALDGTCCLVATHNEEVAAYLDEIFAMKDGRLDEIVTPTAGAAPRS
jgi:putative ABC transport system ATP-binding protein